MADEMHPQRRGRRAWRVVAFVVAVAAVGFAVLLVAAIFEVGPERRRQVDWTAAPAATRPEGPGVVRIEVVFRRGYGGNGTFHTEPIGAGEPIRVVADYDERAYTLEQGFVEDGAGPGWTFRLRFTRRSWLPINPHQTDQELRLLLPRNLPFSLEGHVRWGDSELELGGLSLIRADLDFTMGTHDVRFAEPLTTPLESLALRGNIGALFVHDLGRASPRYSRLEQTVGDLDLDLRGSWAADATIEVGCFMVGCRVQAPDAALAIVNGEPGWPGPGVERELPRPTLRMSTRNALGRLRLEPPGR